jgi:hypothetical protein
MLVSFLQHTVQHPQTERGNGEHVAPPLAPTHAGHAPGGTPNRAGDFTSGTQTPGKLVGNPDYLRHQLARWQERNGGSHGGSFYRSFLLPLFHEGLSQRARAPEVERLLGQVPYLPGSLFDRHRLERSYPAIQIPDAAFERLCAFFDTCDWRLDNPPPPGEQAIHVDMLGALFEGYIHQKPPGAYYTRADITEYIGKSTIIPALFQAAKRGCKAAFRADGPLWSLLRARPDAYLYPALKKGCELALPAEIEAGIADVSQRALWNRAAPATFALPTETWREVVARRQRYAEVKAKLAAGEITSIDALITCNLNSQQFARDAIAACVEPHELNAFYTALEEITVLDPTCGSGAFLFAALNILEPLYQTCLQRMRVMVDAYDQGAATTRSRQARAYALIERFRGILREVAEHSNQEYFIGKVILTKNLYGVDMMEKAVEVCRLRLALKLISRVRTYGDIKLLPDLDFHIRAGNALVGLATAKEVARAISCGEPHPSTGAALHDIAPERFTPNELDGYLTAEYGHDRNAVAAWKESHQPFHWFCEFPDVTRRGGFAVVIGNPPYVEYEAVVKQYRVLHYRTLPCGNLYALTVERGTSLLANGGYFGMIMPASASCTDRYLPLQNILLEQSSLHISSYSDQRGKLFDIPHPRLCIVLYRKGHTRKKVYSTAYIKPGHEPGGQLFEKLTYTDVTSLLLPGIIPRYGSYIEPDIHTKLRGQTRRIGDFVVKHGPHKVYYTRKLSWFVQVTSFVPHIVDEQGHVRKPSELKTLSFGSPEHADIAFVALNSHLFYWFITVGSDCRNLNMREVLGLPLDMDAIAAPVRAELRMLAARLAESLQRYSEMRTMLFQHAGKLIIQCIFPVRSKAILDEIDRVLARHYGFTDEELDFILNYDSKYRARTRETCC